MSNADMLAFASALFCGVLALIVAWNERRSLAHWAFVAGMAALAVEDVCFALTADAASPEEMVHWQNWRLIAMSLQPGIWLLFSLTYARGNYSEFLKRWRLVLVAAFLLPIGLAILFGNHLIVSAGQTETGYWMFGLGIPGTVLNLLCLVGSVLVLMNLEHTYRAAVGTMLWRIKFMILGLGVIFAVRAYASSQVLLFHAVDLSLEAVTATAMLLGGALILRSLFRAGHFNADVYPSPVRPPRFAHRFIGRSLSADCGGVRQGGCVPGRRCLVRVEGVCPAGHPGFARHRVAVRPGAAAYAAVFEPVFSKAALRLSFGMAKVHRGHGFLREAGGIVPGRRETGDRHISSPFGDPLAGGRQAGKSGVRRLNFSVGNQGEESQTAKRRGDGGDGRPGKTSRPH